MDLEHTLNLMGQVNDAAKRRLNDNDSKFDAQLAQKIFMLQPLLKFYGQDMETTHKNELDSFYASLRLVACRDNGELGPLCRLKMMELIELRAMKWRPNLAFTQYHLTRMERINSEPKGSNPGATTNSNSSSSQCSPTARNSLTNIAVLGPTTNLSARTPTRSSAKGIEAPPTSTASVRGPAFEHQSSTNKPTPTSASASSDSVFPFQHPPPAPQIGGGQHPPPVFVPVSELPPIPPFPAGYYLIPAWTPPPPLPHQFGQSTPKKGGTLPFIVQKKSPHTLATSQQQRAPQKTIINLMDTISHNGETMTEKENGAVNNFGTILNGSALPKRQTMACREGILIQNSDSGKVMGVKGSRVKQIEELSGTVISFQKNPTPTGAVTSTTPDSVEVTAQTASNKVRELTILGASHQAIEHAKHLIYTTIQRNISPTRSQHTDELSTAIGSIDSRLTKLNAETLATSNSRCDLIGSKHPLLPQIATDVSGLDLEAMLLKDSAEDERDKELCKASDQKIQSFLDQIFPADDEKPQQNGHHKQNQGDDGNKVHQLKESGIAGISDDLTISSNNPSGAVEVELKQNGTNENKSEQQKVHVKHRNEALTKAPSYSREEMLQMRKSMISMEEEGRGMNSPAIVALRQSDPVVVRHLLPQSAPKVT